MIELVGIAAIICGTIGAVQGVGVPAVGLMIIGAVAVIAPRFVD